MKNSRSRTRREDADTTRPEYDFSKLMGKVVGKYYGRSDPSVFVLVADRPSREGRGAAGGGESFGGGGEP